MSEEQPNIGRADAGLDGVTALPRRQDRRRARSARASIVGAVVVSIALVGTLGAVGYAQYQRGAAAAGTAVQAEDLIEQADVIILEIDEVISSEVTTGLADSATAVLGQVPKAHARLGKALDLATKASVGIGPHRKRADLLHATAQARLTMVEEAVPILALNRDASLALDPARRGWQELLDAEAASASAVERYNLLTRAGVEASYRLNREAAEHLTRAKRDLARAEEEFPQAPFETCIEYVEARLVLNELSLSSDRAWLASDMAKANRIAEAYNAADQKAVALAKELPASVDAMIAEAYERAAELDTDAYYSAREEATELDQRLR